MVQQAISVNRERVAVLCHNIARFPKVLLLNYNIGRVPQAKGLIGEEASAAVPTTYVLSHFKKVWSLVIIVILSTKLSPFIKGLHATSSVAHQELLVRVRGHLLGSLVEGVLPD